MPKFVVSRQIKVYNRALLGVKDRLVVLSLTRAVIHGFNYPDKRSAFALLRWIVHH